METIKGVDREGRIRRDLKNKRKWVFTVWFADKINGQIKWRSYPNIVSVRYKSKSSARKALQKYLSTKKLDSNDEK